MRLMVWWIPQVPMERFYVGVDSVIEGKKLLNILAEYDLFQFEKKVKPDFSNAGGLEEFSGGKWLEWESEECGSINDLSLEEITKKTSKSKEGKK